MGQFFFIVSISGALPHDFRAVSLWLPPNGKSNGILLSCSFVTAGQHLHVRLISVPYSCKPPEVRCPNCPVECIHPPMIDAQWDWGQLGAAGKKRFAASGPIHYAPLLHAMTPIHVHSRSMDVSKIKPYVNFMLTAEIPVVHIKVKRSGNFKR